MRRTVARHWSDEEMELATEIAHLINGYPGDIIGALWIARSVGISRSKVYDVMPLVAILTPTLYPGKALTVTPDAGGALYCVTDDKTLIISDIQSRSRKHHTITRRLHAVADPLRGRTDMESMVVVEQVDRMLRDVESLERFLDAMS